MGPLTVSLRGQGGKIDGRPRDGCSVATTHEVRRGLTRRSRPDQSGAEYLATGDLTRDLLNSRLWHASTLVTRFERRKGDGNFERSVPHLTFALFNWAISRPAEQKIRTRSKKRRGDQCQTH